MWLADCIVCSAVSVWFHNTRKAWSFSLSLSLSSPTEPPVFSSVNTCFKDRCNRLSPLDLAWTQPGKTAYRLRQYWPKPSVRLHYTCYSISGQTVYMGADWWRNTHFKHRFPAPSSLRKDVVNQCLKFGRNEERCTTQRIQNGFSGTFCMEEGCSKDVVNQCLESTSPPESRPPLYVHHQSTLL